MSQLTETPIARDENRTPSPVEEAVPSLTVLVLHGATELLDHVAAWDDLAKNAAEPNPFYESWNLLPALAHFGTGLDLRFVLIYQPINAQRRVPVLCGFFPLVRRRLHRLIPITVLESLQHLYCFLTTPLLRAGSTNAVMGRFFDWASSDPEGAPLWRMELATRDAAFGQALTQACHHRARPSFVVESYGRAFITVRQSAEGYLEQALPGKRRKDLRRKARQFADKGRVDRLVLRDESDLDTWTENFLRLEAAGWKGREGTAMLSSSAGADYFRTMTRGAFRRGKLLMLGLFLDGEPIAMKCNFVSGQGSFAYKIAFDETHPACSPGVLLELFNIEHIHTMKEVRWMDSCTIPDHPMIDRLWSERRVVQTQYVATGRGPGDLVVSAMPVARWLRRSLRRSRRPILLAEQE